MFAKHHYLSHTHNNAANVFIAIINDEVAGFISVLPQPGKIPKNRRVHRLVILPDYQGAGFGIKFLNEIGKEYKKNDYRFTINTTAPSLIYALKKSKEWNCHHFGRVDGGKNTMGKTGLRNRITASFELK